MSIVIWGAGAIGATLGAYLLRAGHDILFVDNAVEHVRAINQEGLQIVGPIEEFKVKAKAVTSEQLEGQYEVVLLATKSQHTEQATEMIKPHLKDDGYLVSVQNGLNELIIQKIVGKERTVGAFVNFGADYHGPGLIFFGGRGAVVLGEIDGSKTERLKSLHKIFLDFDANSHITDNLWGYLWGKEAYGAMLFVTALTNESIADALADTKYRELYIQAAQDILLVARQLGIKCKDFNGFVAEAYLPPVDEGAVNESMNALVEFNRKSAKTHSGIWRDLAVRKRPTEVSMYDIITSEGERLGVSMAFTYRWIEMIREIEEGRRALSITNLDELKASLA